MLYVGFLLNLKSRLSVLPEHFAQPRACKLPSELVDTHLFSYELQFSVKLSNPVLNKKPQQVEACDQILLL